MHCLKGNEVDKFVFPVEGECMELEEARRSVGDDGGEFCTGNVEAYAGLTPNAAYGQQCLHKCAVWQGKEWCTAGEQQGPSQPAIWGWCHKCDEVPEFQCKVVEGDLVEANWQNAGRWYDGTVSDVGSDGGRCMYDIAYDDGDEESNVPDDLVRKIVFGEFGECHRVEGNYGGGGDWYAGRISTKDGWGEDAIYGIKYDDGDTEDGMSARYIRDLEDEHDGTTYNAGDTIQANYRARGRWYMGTIETRVSACCYDIAYDDGDSEDCVDPNNIRVIEHMECMYEEGAAVLANWQGYGQWFPAMVTFCGYNGYSVAYNDGSSDTEEGVASQFIIGNRAECENVQTDANYCGAGCRVTAQFSRNGGWYDGVICDQPGSCGDDTTRTICFDDTDVDTDVSQDRIQLILP